MNKNNCILYIIRHGETDWNVKQIVQGHAESKLTANGKKQVKELAKKLKNSIRSFIFIRSIKDQTNF